MQRSYKELRSQSWEFTSRLSSMKLKLQQAEAHNKERDKLEEKLSRSNKLLHKVDTYLLCLETIRAKSIAEDLSYKNRRMEHVESYITTSVGRVFPWDNFKVKISCNFSRNNNKAELRLIDRLGNSRIPRLSEGGLNQQLISLSSSVGVTNSFGKNKLYIDEAFSASSPENRPKLGNIIGELVEDGMQVFLIAQSSESYRHLPRREFHLDVDPVSLQSVIIDILDY